MVAAAILNLFESTRNILDCDQSNYSSRIILAHIPAKLAAALMIMDQITYSRDRPIFI